MPARSRRKAWLRLELCSRLRGALPVRVLLLFAFIACVHPVAVRSDPAGAYVSMDGVRVGVTPYIVEVKRRQTVTVEMVGYRPLSFWVGPATPDAIEVRLIPEHGGAGTWEPSEAR